MSSRASLETRKRPATSWLPGRDLKPVWRPFLAMRGSSPEASDHDFVDHADSAIASHDFSRIPVQAENPGTASKSDFCPLPARGGPRACPFGGACHACPVRVQAKTDVNEPGDEFEDEANKIAHATVLSPDPSCQEGRHDIEERRFKDMAQGLLAIGERSGKGIQCAPSVEEEAEDAVGDDDEYEIGNTMDLITAETPLDNLMASPSIEKRPQKKAKMGGPLGEVKEGLGKPSLPLPKGCADWIKIKRTTYPYDPGKGADPVEKDFIDTYSDFIEGVAISKPLDFNSKLKKATENPCTCLENLNIDGHGASWSGGGQEFAPRKFALGKRSFGVKKGKGGKLVPYNFHVFDGIRFCRPCLITLGGCYVALNKPRPEAGAGGLKGAGDALGKALTKKTGCSVKAYTGVTITPKAGEFKGQGKGKWTEWKPEG